MSRDGILAFLFPITEGQSEEKTVCYKWSLTIG